ncbi:peptidylprolyl isomerase [candidate division KSB1 bacterium]|nr:peptidylprolyl isomerase [candidate division KSB1 bacterium]
MKTRLFIVLAALIFSISCNPSAVTRTDNPVIVIQTEVGDIEVELYPDKAPVTVANFLAYVDAGAYESGRFHRTVTMENQPNNDVKIEVIQGDKNPGSEVNFDAIPLERTNVTGLLHKDGVISMARGGPDTATASFFICINDQPSLDFGGARNADGQGFAAFGMVLSGMDVVREIQYKPYGGRTGQLLEPPIGITNIIRK